MKFKPYFMEDDAAPDPNEGPWYEVHSLKEMLDIEYPGGLVKARGQLAQTHFKSEYFVQASKLPHEYVDCTYVGYLLEYYETGKWCIRGFVVDELPAKDEYAVWNQEAGDWEIKENAPNRF